MMYINAADVLPKDLLQEVQKYVKSGLVYIPGEDKTAWGLKSGSKDYFQERNQEIREKYRTGASFDELAEHYALAYSTIKKIVYHA